MGLGFIGRVLLLGVALWGGCVSAAETAAQAPAASGASSKPDSAALPGRQKTHRTKKNRPGIKDGKSANKEMVPTGGAASNGGAEGSIPQNIPADEPPHLALRGVRG